MTPPTLEERLAALEKAGFPPKPSVERITTDGPKWGALTNVIAMIGEALHSKKFMAMATAGGLSLAGVDKFANAHPWLAVSIVAAAGFIVSAYILGQSIVDAAKERKS